MVTRVIGEVPAFGMLEIHSNGGLTHAGGMTLRDYFAAKAMQGFCGVVGFSDSPNDEQVACYSYAMADAMLKARDA